jgi:xylose isomerase
MARKYSVFLGNVGTCSDRYCPEYAPPFTLSELFDRAVSIPLLGGVDLVLTPDLLAGLDEVTSSLERTGLEVVSVAVDHFTQAKWRQGSFSSVDPAVREEAVQATCEAMDLGVELGCRLVTIWPGQDGYDYPFQADYEAERTWFAEGVREACRHRDEVTVTLEYKLKEPRTHSYVNTVGTTILLVQEIGEPNCGVAFDYGHALLGYESPAESVALLSKYGDLLKHVHINDNYRLWDDDMIVGSARTLEYLEFFYWLRRTGYDGWLTIDQYPYREDGRDAVAESAEWMDALQSLAERADPDEVAATLASKDGVAASRLMRKLLLG